MIYAAADAAREPSPGVSTQTWGKPHAACRFTTNALKPQTYRSKFDRRERGKVDAGKSTAEVCKGGG
jgi:hypothetical protein